MRKKASKINGNGIIRKHQRLINSGADIIMFLTAKDLRKKKRLVKEILKARLLENPCYLISFRASLR